MFSWFAIPPEARRLNRIAIVAATVAGLSFVFGGSIASARDAFASTCGCACGTNCGGNCCCAKPSTAAKKPDRAKVVGASIPVASHADMKRGQRDSTSNLSIRSCPRNCPGAPSACGGFAGRPAAIVDSTAMIVATLVGDFAELDSLISDEPFRNGLLRPPRV
jgi:hypothetical protein